jgi:DNA-binding transcriptional regulator YiaG
MNERHESSESTSQLHAARPRWTESRSAESQAAFAAAVGLTRQRLGLSRAQFGSPLGATADTICSWERGRTFPELGRLRRVSIALGWGDPLRWPPSKPPWMIIAAGLWANDAAVAGPEQGPDQRP